jgi:hypothetical protein
MEGLIQTVGDLGQVQSRRLLLPEIPDQRPIQGEILADEYRSL